MYVCVCVCEHEQKNEKTRLCRLSNKFLHANCKRFCMKSKWIKSKTEPINWSSRPSNITIACLFIDGTFFLFASMVNIGRFLLWKVEFYLRFRLMCFRLFICNIHVFVCSEVGVSNHTQSPIADHTCWNAAQSASAYHFFSQWLDVCSIH